MSLFINPLPDAVYVGRKKEIPEDIRGHYFRDQTKIIHSSAFRRLKHKTQVFFSPHDDHICTRMEHALIVSTVASTICRAFRLDAELAEAIALAHDFGHTPFGHAGEEILDVIAGDIGGYKHELKGLRVVDILQNNGEGLNLTYAVRDGIISHCGESFEQYVKPGAVYKELEGINENTVPVTWEGCVVRVSDKISYIGRDLEDAMEGMFLSKEVVSEIKNKFGQIANREIINKLVLDVIEWSSPEKGIGFSAEGKIYLDQLYGYSKKHIYNHPEILQYREYCEKILKALSGHLLDLYDSFGERYPRYMSSPRALDRHFGAYLQKHETVYRNNPSGIQRVVDYISGMTDNYALRCMEEISLPRPINFNRKYFE
ncbi:MAG: deoxyguanosinetriphosphate triphosphohydrolase family protein [Bacillota bacterium]